MSQREEFALGVLSPGSVSPEEGLGPICIRKIIPNDCVLDPAEGFFHSLHEVQGSELGRWRWGGGGDTVTPWGGWRIERCYEVSGMAKPELSASLGSSVGWVWKPKFSVCGRCKPGGRGGVYIFMKGDHSGRGAQRLGLGGPRKKRLRRRQGSRHGRMWRRLAAQSVIAISTARPPVLPGAGRPSEVCSL